MRRPPAAQLRVEITVADLARATGWSRHTTLRRLRASDCVYRQIGVGAKRRHYATTWLEIEDSNFAYVLEAITHMKALFARATSPAGEDEDGDEP